MRPAIEAVLMELEAEIMLENEIRPLTPGEQTVVRDHILGMLPIMLPDAEEAQK